jgi:hypothetical protein
MKTSEHKPIPATPPPMNGSPDMRHDQFQGDGLFLAISACNRACTCARKDSGARS